MDSRNRKKEEGDFDVIGILKIGWDRRQFIFKVTAGFTVFGLLVALLSPKEYAANSTFLPQVESVSSRGEFGGLASLAGISLGGAKATSEIPPSLYPKIVESVTFKSELIKTPVTFKEEGIETTYENYFEKYHDPGILSKLKKYTIGLPGVVRNFFSGTPESKDDALPRNSSLFKLTSREVKHFSRIDSQIEINYNSKEKTVKLSFNMPEAIMAAQMAEAAKELLQREVIAFRIQNAKEQLQFTQQQFDEKRLDFLEKQRELANFRDRNRNIASAIAQNQLQRLEAEYDFAFNLYTEMAKQLEQAKLQVSRDTPIFSIINPVIIPHIKAAPNRLLIIIGFMVFGFILAVAVLFIQYFLLDVKEEFALKEAEG